MPKVYLDVQNTQDTAVLTLPVPGVYHQDVCVSDSQERGGDEPIKS
jgi:hypothetical protein